LLLRAKHLFGGCPAVHWHVDFLVALPSLRACCFAPNVCSWLPWGLGSSRSLIFAPCAALRGFNGDPLMAKTIVAGVNFNDAGPDECLNGVVERLRTDIEQCVESVPLSSEDAPR
jgi:hypothetical protein